MSFNAAAGLFDDDEARKEHGGFAVHHQASKTAISVANAKN
jgi:hypothetical protein